MTRTAAGTEGTSVMAHWAGNEAPGKGRYLGRFLRPTGTSLPGHADTPAHPLDRDDTCKPGPVNPRENRPGVTHSDATTEFAEEPFLTATDNLSTLPDVTLRHYFNSKHRRGAQGTPVIVRKSFSINAMRP
jgi:hypothetical protein